MKKNKMPLILCEEVWVGESAQWRFWCPFCRTVHYHGAGPGHVVAHCDPDSPLYEHGYLLALDTRFSKTVAPLFKGRWA
jgi:hypothetical protein